MSRSPDIIRRYEFIKTIRKSGLYSTLQNLMRGGGIGTIEYVESMLETDPHDDDDDNEPTRSSRKHDRLPPHSLRLRRVLPRVKGRRVPHPPMDALRP